MSLLLFLAQQYAMQKVLNHFLVKATLDWAHAASMIKPIFVLNLPYLVPTEALDGNIPKF